MNTSEERPSGLPEFDDEALDSPVSQLYLFQRILSQFEKPGREHVAALALLFADEGINICRVIRENRELAEEIIEVDLASEPTEQMAERYDRLAGNEGDGV